MQTHIQDLPKNPALPAAGTSMIAALMAANTMAQIDILAPLLWRGWSEGVFDDDQAAFLSKFLENRRSAIRPLDRLAIRAPSVCDAARANGRQSHFPPKRKAQAPAINRHGIERRRKLAASGGLPHQIAVHFTLSEQAVLTILVIYARAGQDCRLSLAEVAARAGCKTTTARNAFRKAAQLGFVVIQERRQTKKPNLPNIVRIISKLWLEWVHKVRPFPRHYSPFVRINKGGSKKIESTNTVIYNNYNKGERASLAQHLSPDPQNPFHKRILRAS